MNELQSKIQEVGKSILPIVIFVSLVSLLLVPVETPVIYRFFIGSILLFLGLAIFLWGIDQSMEPIGRHLAGEMARSKKTIYAVVLSFILGFLVTVAEPDLMILGEQVSSATGGLIGARFLVIMVSIGVGVMIAIGTMFTLFSKPLKWLMGAVYLVVFMLAIFVSDEFFAISFDASGATTGALTTPFILALSVGLSRIKGGKSSEADSFGLVGVMSSGPILAVMLMSVISRQSNIQGQSVPFVASDDIFGPITSAIGPTFVESIISLLPISILFFIYNFAKFKLSLRNILSIVRGLIYTLIGLTFFLVGANAGFMDMGRLLGVGLTAEHSPVLMVLGFILGFIVVSAEPAVHVLGEQIEEVTTGQIPIAVIRKTLSIGVGIAVALSMLRILEPSVKLWYFIVPGFIIAIILSFYVDPIFVGIAYDAGGVASGPMSATFVLAFAQGVADQWPTADVLADGFGIIAMIAMTPILSIMVLGSLFKARQKQSERRQRIDETQPCSTFDLIPMEQINGDVRDLLVVIVDRGMADNVIEYAREIGARGATVLRGRDARAKAWSTYALSLDPIKEIIWFLLPTDMSSKLCNALEKADPDLLGGNLTSFFVLPATSVAGMNTPFDLSEIDEDIVDQDVDE